MDRKVTAILRDALEQRQAANLTAAVEQHPSMATLNNDDLLDSQKPQGFRNKTRCKVIDYDKGIRMGKGEGKCA